MVKGFTISGIAVSWNLCVVLVLTVYLRILWPQNFRIFIMDLKIFIIAKFYDLFISMIAESSDPFGFDHKIFEILL